jgi:transcriptional regulator with XRE-family HTH domain
MSRIGTRIAGLRRTKGLTEKQLAKQIGVSDKVVIEIESGKRVISDDLIKRVSKVLGEEINDLNAIVSDNVPEKEEKVSPRVSAKQSQPEVQKVWNDAFESVLKAVPIYTYSLDKVLNVKQLPIVSNKVEGFSKEKVLYIEIQDNDMIGFRIIKGDLAFGCLTSEIENNTICLVECEGKRVVRQIKKLDSEKVMLLYNNGKLSSETVSVKSLKVLARLVRLEVNL